MCVGGNIQEIYSFLNLHDCNEWSSGVRIKNKVQTKMLTTNNIYIFIDKYSICEKIMTSKRLKVFSLIIMTYLFQFYLFPN